FLEAFGRLPGRWEIKISGGEPFVHPTLDKVVEGLARLGHRISVVTNFSASDAKLEQFVRAAQGRIGVFSASLHPEYVKDAEAFFTRAQALQARLLEAANPDLPKPHVCVTLVATRNQLPRLTTLAEQAHAVGV